MRKHWIGGGLLGAGLLLFLGLVFVSGQGTTPSAEAQTACDDDVQCLVVTKEAEEDEEFSFSSDANEGDFEIDTGESMALSTDDGESITVTEDELDGWTLAGIDCDDNDIDGVDIDVNEDDGSVTVDFADVADGEFATVECTFTNEMEATPTATATATGTATATATSTAEATATTTTTSQSAATPVVPTPIAPTPQPPASEVQSGTISPPTTGSAGLK
jgi:hypothetical protein